MGNDDNDRGAHSVEAYPARLASHRTLVPSDHPITETVDGVTYSSVLRVKADPTDITDDERKRRVKALAGAIAHGLRRFGEIHIRAIGKDANYKAIKALIEASAFVAVHNHDLYTRPGYMMAGDVKGKDEMTGITFLVVTSQSRRQDAKGEGLASDGVDQETAAGASMERIAARELLRRWLSKYVSTCEPGPSEYDRDAAELCESTAELLGLGYPWDEK